MESNVVGVRALRIALAISLVFIVIVTLLGFAFAYRHKIAAVEAEIENRRLAQTPGLVEGLWNYDYDLLRALVEGFAFYPYIDYVSVAGTNGPAISTGATREGDIVRDYPLTRAMPGAVALPIGKLRVELDSRRILADVVEQTLIMLLAQVIFLVVEAFVVLSLFSRMVTRHLSRIAAHVKEYDARSEAGPLTLEKKHRGDELDTLVDAFNHMRRNFELSRAAELAAIEGLRMSEERNRVLVEEAPDAILMYDVDLGHFIACNVRAETLLGRRRDELLRMHPAELFTVEQPDGLPIRESIAADNARAIAGEGVLVRRRLLDPSGRVMVCEARLNRIPPEERKILRVSYLDISDRVRAEEEVARSLREKEVLLREVYHRTKNNMQLIAALLSMQAISCGDERLSAILDKMIDRIASMALVHQKLYEAKDLSRIDLGDYIEDLLGEIKQAYLLDRPNITIRLEAEPGILVLLDTAIPFALALNELIVNAVRHAFPGNRRGRILVGLSRSGSSTLMLSVKDDGVGFPPGFDFRRDGGMGLQTIVSLLEEQLRGTVSFGPGPGTVCTATIRDDVYQSRL